MAQSTEVSASPLEESDLEEGFYVFQQVISQNGHWDNGVRIGVAEVYEDTCRAVYSKEVWQGSILNLLSRFTYDKRLARAAEKAEKIRATLGSEALQDVELEQG